MLRIKDRSVAREYTYTDPITGVTFKSYRIGQLVQKIKLHRIANKIPITEDLAPVIEEEFCKKMPDACVERGGVNFLKMGGDFVKAMWRWGQEGFPMVTNEVFEERKATCLACPQWRGYREYGVGFCGKCGCPSGRISIKQWLTTEHCPLNKWPH